MHALLKLSKTVDWLNSQIGKHLIWLILASTVISAVNAAVRKYLKPAEFSSVAAGDVEKKK